MEHIYKKEDIEKAYDMGLENAIIILEKSMSMSETGRRELINMLKQMRTENRLKSFYGKH